MVPKGCQYNNLPQCFWQFSFPFGKTMQTAAPSQALPFFSVTMVYMRVHVFTLLFIKSYILRSLVTLNLISRRTGGSYESYKNSNWERPCSHWGKTLVSAWLIQAHKGDRPQDIRTTVLDPIMASFKPQPIMDGRKNISNTATIEQLYPLVYPSGTADGEWGFVCSTLHKSCLTPDLELSQLC